MERTDYYKNLHCSNEVLIKELQDKEDLFSKISERVMRCPHCKKGHFMLEHSDLEYSNESWWMCDNCLECDGTPSKLREKMIEDIVVMGYDDYWDYEIWDFVQQFEYEYPRTYKENEQKTREFDPVEWNKEKHRGYNHYDPSEFHFDDGEILVWEDFVGDRIKTHIKCIDKAIEEAKKYKMLKQFFKENGNGKETNI